MTVEKFLYFWNAYNTTIIEVLIGFILFTIVLLAYKSFFGAEPEVQVGGAQFEELEKSLKKIIETQVSPQSTGGQGDVPAEVKAELEKLKLELVTKESEIQDLKLKVASPEATNPAGAQAATAASPASGISEEVKNQLEAKIKELEARLAEYEIISEDIADLSFYKEENNKLQREIEQMKALGSLNNTAANKPVEAQPQVSNPEAAAVAPAVEPTTETPNADQALNEMAQAAQSMTKTVTDESQLMNQFEDFVKKGPA